MSPVLRFAHGGALALAATLSACLATSATAAPFVESEVEAFSYSFATQTDEGIAEDSDSDSTSTPGALASAQAEATGCIADDNSLCAVIPDTTLATARARTDYGANRVYVAGKLNSVGSTVSHTDFAQAVSRWQDDWTLGGNVTGLPDFTITLQVDGSWRGEGAFALKLLVVDTWLGTELDETTGEPVGTIGRGVMTNACGGTLDGQLPFASGECDPPVLPPGVPPSVGRELVVDVNPDGDSSGTFNAALQVTAPWNVGRTYRILADMIAITGPDSLTELDAESTARVTSVLIPQGGTLASAAGALDNYNVTSVPVPAVGWLLVPALGALGLRARRRPRS
jgi:hypothetical protein